MRKKHGRKRRRPRHRPSSEDSPSAFTLRELQARDIPCKRARHVCPPELEEIFRGTGSRRKVEAIYTVIVVYRLAAGPQGMQSLLLPLILLSPPPFATEHRKVPARSLPASPSPPRRFQIFRQLLTSVEKHEKRNLETENGSGKFLGSIASRPCLDEILTSALTAPRTRGIFPKRQTLDF